MGRKKQKRQDRRKYIRLKSVFPVEFRVVSDTEPRWQQGFTSDVSTDGICLKINNADEQYLQDIYRGGMRLSLRIDIPLTGKGTNALAKITWIRKEKDAPINRYAVGLEFVKVDPAEAYRMVRYARRLRSSGRLAFYCVFIVGLYASFMYVNNVEMRYENQDLVQKLVNSVRQEEVLEGNLQKLSREKENAEDQILAYGERAAFLEKKITEVQIRGDERLEKEVSDLKEELSLAKKEKKKIEKELLEAERKTKEIQDSLVSIKQEKEVLKKATIEKMYTWLSIHQNPRTGLVMSFEGDQQVGDWAFIYDQSLAAQAYLLFDDTERAKKIFNFFQRTAPETFEGFANAYFASSEDVAEYSVHAGPNIWVGIALLQYFHKTSSDEYMPLTKKIADWLIAFQEQDPEGGIRGGPKDRWFSTEHNLDAFAFFSMFYEITGEQKYNLARDKVLQWVVAHAYDKTEVPIKRGKGDATIATDTYAWSIAALGPKLLKKVAMDPDEIITFAEENCGVQVNYERSNGEVIAVKGFDFAKYRNMPREGIISTEWTAQMVLAFKIMQEYYRTSNDVVKSEYYAGKYSDYVSELEKLVISSPSPTGQGEGCLPYATEDDVDTGHGWRTPRGKSTGSLAATAYTIFAQKGYNPLQLKK
ncbi:PilZ domain-containing protein [Candidatus Omnitrophota bacterium]